MVTIKTRMLETENGPVEITVQNVQYWSQHTKELMHSQAEKAQKFVENNCYVYFGDGKFACNPIRGYNMRIYNLEKKNGLWVCDCQGYVTKEKRGELKEDGVNCSHLLGLMYAFKIKYFQQLN